MFDALLSFHFIRPYFLLALPIIVLLALIIRKKAYQTSQSDEVIAHHLKAALTPKQSLMNKIKPIDFTLLLGVFLCIACAGPAWRPVEQSLDKGPPIAILVKLSQSMRANDFSPTRLSYAKLKLNDLLNFRSQAEHSLIAYAHSSHRVLPLTKDNQVFLPFIEALSPNVMPNNQNLYNDDLANAVALAHQEVSIEGGSILVIADTISKAQLAALNKSQIPFIWWQFATINGGVITDEQGSLRTNQRGEPEISALSPTVSNTPEMITPVTATLTNQDIFKINQIARTTRKRFERQEATEYQDMAWHVAIVVLLLALLWFRKGWTSPVNHSAISSTNNLILVVCLCSFTFSEPLAAKPQDWFLTSDQQGAIAFKQHQYEKAADLFSDANWQAKALYENGQYLKAAEIYATLGTVDGFYNRATALLKGKQYQLAIDAFQQVLKLSPEMAEAKHNLAIAKQAYKIVIAQSGKKDLEQNIAIDDEPTTLANPTEGDFVDYHVSSTLSQDAKEQWMRTVNADMAEFLATKFANELAKSQGAEQ